MSTATLPASSTSGFLAALAGKVARRVLGLVQAYSRRRDLQTLAGFDDRMLQDVGLTRGDLRDAIAEPLWRDPTAILVRRVRERRRSHGGWRRIESAPTIAAPPTVPAAPGLDLDEWSSTRRRQRSRS